MTFGIDLACGFRVLKEGRVTLYVPMKSWLRFSNCKRRFMPSRWTGC